MSVSDSRWETVTDWVTLHSGSRKRTLESLRSLRADYEAMVEGLEQIAAREVDVRSALYMPMHHRARTLLRRVKERASE